MDINFQKPAVELFTNTYVSRLEGDLSFLTVTLPPKFYQYSSLTQYELSYHTLNSMLYTYTNDYIMFAELTDQGNVHYHAVIKADKLSKISLINKCKRSKNIGFVHIRNVDDKTKAAKYLVKEYEITRKTIKTNVYKPPITTNYMEYHNYIRLNSK